MLVVPVAGSPLFTVFTTRFNPRCPSSADGGRLHFQPARGCRLPHLPHLPRLPVPVVYVRIPGYVDSRLRLIAGSPFDLVVDLVGRLRCCGFGCSGYRI